MTDDKKAPPLKWPGDLNKDQERLKALDSQVRQAKSVGEQAKHEAFDPARPTTGMGLGLKLGVDLTVATSIGFALGWGLDILMGTKPWMMLVFLILGFAAGVRMVVASAQDYAQRMADYEQE